MPKAPKAENPAPAAPASFEDALAELETLVARLEDGELPLEASLTAYKRGAELLQYCQARLKDAQQQIKVLDGETLRDFNLDDE